MRNNGPLAVFVALRFKRVAQTFVVSRRNIQNRCGITVPDCVQFPNLETSPTRRP